jgi:hypothetical protein
MKVEGVADNTLSPSPSTLIYFSFKLIFPPANAHPTWKGKDRGLDKLSIVIITASLTNAL